MIKFGTVSTANITPRALIYPCMDEPKASVGCIASRDKRRAEGFAQWHGISRVYDNYIDVIEDDVFPFDSEFNEIWNFSELVKITDEILLVKIA